VEGVTYRVQVVVPSDKVDHARVETVGPNAEPIGHTELRYFSDEPLECADYRRDQLPAGSKISGPAILREDLATTLVGPRQQATVGTFGELVIEVTR
jgi:N-methylhydantoinase A